MLHAYALYLDTNSMDGYNSKIIGLVAYTIYFYALVFAHMGLL